MREICHRIDDHVLQVSTMAGSAAHPTDDTIRDRLSALGRALASTSRDANGGLQDLDDALRDLATMPVAAILEPLHRAVRELCREHRKEARLALVGGEHAVERRLLEALSPLIGHLVRNAVDHGLERPEEREQAGKDPVGAISIRVEQQGNLVMVDVSDDGAGIDIGLVGRSAVAKGIISEDVLPTLSPQQVARLVFEDGLSTRTSVTETSGRGVGLAAVHREVERLGGHVDVTSQRGQGTRFVMVLSAAIGSTPVVVVRVEGRLMAVPLGAILSAKAANPAEFVEDAGTITVAHNDERIAAHDLGALLGLRSARSPSRGQPLFVIVTASGRAAIAVDEVLGDREIVLRALPLELRDVPAYRGIGMLAQREIVLVCNPEWLVHPFQQAAE
jgi:chemotaxis protein histidine kinase CheA